MYDSIQFVRLRTLHTWLQFWPLCQLHVDGGGRLGGSCVSVTLVAPRVSLYLIPACSKGVLLRVSPPICSVIWSRRIVLGGVWTSTNTSPVVNHVVCINGGQVGVGVCWTCVGNVRACVAYLLVSSA